MISRFVAIVCVALSVSVIGSLSAEISVAQGDGLSAEEIAVSSKNSAIGSIKRNMTERQVQRILGKPSKRQRVKESYCGETLVSVYHHR
jgi:outer membrane protein assembly factor BamE (lipoprotein component of BamABCDE complex)